MQERGYTVGNKDDFEADITINVAESFLMIGSIKNDKGWCTVGPADGSVIYVASKEFNLAEPDSCNQIGDYLEHLMGGYNVSYKIQLSLNDVYPWIKWAPLPSSKSTV